MRAMTDFSVFIFVSPVHIPYNVIYCILKSGMAFRRLLTLLFTNIHFFNGRDKQKIEIPLEL